MNLKALKAAKILLVDDNPINLKLLFQYLTGFGFQILIAQDGESALEQIQREKHDLVLLDIMIPGINSYNRYFLHLQMLIGSSLSKDQDGNGFLTT